MRMKKTAQITVDALMSVLLLVMFAVPWTGVLRHERLGVILFVLFAVHNAIHFRWYASLFRGPYNAYRTVWAGINIGLLAAMLAVALSGVMISQHVFGFLEINGSLFWRRLHLCASYWGLILTGAHIGLHLPQRPQGTPVKILCLLFGAYGLYACAALHIWNKLLFLETFSAYAPSAAASAIQHLGAAWLFALLTRGFCLKIRQNRIR
ncbi:MAG: DUF4405 domain-containing protein [Candidatus Avelusimicrobium sp.]|uniref:DUF4405 domain-containing protein n=1 Tax=Candidatus Avelusimicrobium sp. TaxID=3048833 RepID=UPI003F0FC8D2